MKKEIIDLTQKLIRQDSSNPPGKEKGVALFIQKYLQGIDIKSKRYEFKKNRPNIVCELPSRTRKKKVLLTPHIDVVPPTGKWKYPPFSGTYVKGKIYGRGATDDKANVAVTLATLKEFKSKNRVLDNIDLICAFTADEETGSDYGIRPLIRRLKNIDYGIVLDSNEFDMIVAQKGLLHLRVEVYGKEAHGAYPWRGKNAIEKTMNIIGDIKKEPLFKKVHPLLKSPTLNVGKIEGGEKVNIVAGYCACELDIRYVPPLKETVILERIEKIIKIHTGTYTLKILANQGPVEIDHDHFLVGLMRKILVQHNIPAHCKPSFGATVLTFLEARGIESFAFGFGSRGCAHTVNEYVKVSNLIKGTKVLYEYLEKLDRYFDEH
ncbi:MAG: M20 family metallopeptidase [Candidatus Omnitrophica bacterium]|nr:M20 family metallopeptidase [Candidatus Omnitrophota bacterium]